jgi:hypothetical protein
VFAIVKLVALERYQPSGGMTVWVIVLAFAPVSVASGHGDAAGVG